MTSVKKIACSFLLLLVFPALRSQTVEKKPAYVADLSAGLLAGSSQTNWTVSASVARVFATGWSVGLASGLDHYVFRSVPVIAQVRKELGKGRRHPFAFAGAGINLAWPTSAQRSASMIGWGVEDSDFGHGICTDIGMGYTFFNRRGKGLFTSVSHSFKSMSESRMEQNWSGGRPEETLRRLDYRFSRLAIRLGYRF